MLFPELGSQGSSPLDNAVPFEDVKHLSCRGPLLGIHQLAAIYELLNVPRALLWNPAHPTCPTSDPTCPTSHPTSDPTCPPSHPTCSPSHPTYPTSHPTSDHDRLKFLRTLKPCKIPVVISSFQVRMRCRVCILS